MPDPCPLASGPTGLERQVAILWRAQAEFRAGLAAGDSDRLETALDVLDMLVSRAEPRSALHQACGRALICLHDELLVAEHRRRQAARPRRSRKPAALTADLVQRSEVRDQVSDYAKRARRFHAARGIPECVTRALIESKVAAGDFDRDDGRGVD